MSTAPDTTPTAPGVTPTDEPDEPLVDDDRETIEDYMLVEDVSIDGMSGVY
jgi:mycofactocin precursor